MENVAISIRLTHPTIDPEWITAGMGLPPTLCWERGAQRTTPRGDLLKGTYRGSYWCRAVPLPADCELPEAIERALVVARPARAFLSEFIDGGGSAELFIGWLHGPGATIDHATLRELADLQLDLALDVYLAPDTKSCGA